MDDEEWQRQLLVRSGTAVRKRRLELGMTGQQVCTACGELGFAITTSTLSKLERASRTTASFGVIEWLVLAQVLKTPPALLIFPVADTSPTVRIAPDKEVPAWEATAWLTGETAVAREPSADSPRGQLEAFRSHNRAIQATLVSAQQAEKRRRNALLELDGHKRAQLDALADTYEELARKDGLELRELRLLMREHGLLLPALPAELHHIDTQGEGGA